MPNLLLVMMGGALGAGMRYGVGLAAARRLGAAFPWGTLLVNLAGGLCAGLLLGFLLDRGGTADPWRLFLGVGLLGGFTTFSAFSAETAYMLQRGDVGQAASYVLVSVAGALALLFAGLWLARAAA
ncbi:fluoride efflux transporter CrcB [Sphingosinicella sp. CPCC 101087]|uniref:fluoride efflux transporter CrcB n=1 Tax=Sphingosinicella sp. CPCC 101087 TaxID=2497754 RepID=UPI00101CB3A3|nr:fluoride efflux transporter CrcB [Sphingosinicella sp. CPCC 101087]